MKPWGKSSCTLCMKEIISRHCCGLGFLRKMFSEVSGERVRILIIRNFLRYSLEVLFHSFFRVFWVFPT